MATKKNTSTKKKTAAKSAKAPAKKTAPKKKSEKKAAPKKQPVEEQKPLFRKKTIAERTVAFKTRNWPAVIGWIAIALFSLLDALTEDTIIVAQAVTCGRQIQRSQRVKEASCQATQAAIAQACVHFVIA